MKKKIFDILLLCAIALALGYVCIRFFHLSSSRFTNNAQVHQDMVSVSCKVQGYIRRIGFSDYSYVRKGDTLVVIEDAEYRLALAQAEAAWHNATSARSAANRSIKTAQNNVAVSEAAIGEVKANLDNARTNFERYSKLLESGAVTRQEFENVQTQYLSLQARYETMSRQKESSSLVWMEQQERLEQSEAADKAAEVALEIARLNLSYTVITAPCSGHASAQHIQEGELMQPGILSGGWFGYFAIEKMNLGFKGLTALSLAFICAYALGAATAISPQTSLSQLYLPIFLYGFGHVLLFVALTTYIEGVIPIENRFHALSILGFSRIGCGSAIGSALFGRMFAETIRSTGSMTATLRDGFVLAAMIGIITIIALAIRSLGGRLPCAKCPAET